jgi:hypothetical protein
MYNNNKILKKKYPFIYPIPNHWKF